MTDVLIDRPELEGLGIYEFGWADSDAAGASARRGISPEVVADISALKAEPEWMLQRRQRALQLFERKPMPTWGADLSEIDFDNIKYFVRSTEKQAQTWEDLPDDIKNTYERLGIPEAERQRLVAGVAAQYESEVVYHQINEELERKGVIFMDTDTALREHPEFFEEYFGTVIPAGDNKFAALNTAVWSGGSFVYVPPGVHVEIPLQAYFRINTENMGQFERTLIIADEGSYVHYIEGCTAPIYKSRLAALGRRRDHREEERPRALHDDPELVEQRLQPRDQAGDRGRGRHHGVDRRQHRLEGHDEVPVDLPDGRAREGRDPLGRLRRPRPAPGRRRQDDPHGAVHAVVDRLEVDRARRRPCRLPRRGPRRRERAPLGEHRALRRAARRHDLPLRHVPGDRHPRRRRAARPRGHGLEGERGAALLPACPAACPRTRRWR